MSIVNILIIDDDAEDAKVLQEAVKQCLPLADCRVVESAALAFSLANEFVPRFVFLDAPKYATEGKETLRELSQLPQLENTTFIVIAGYMHSDEQDEFNDLGANFVVAKPATYDSLQRFIQHILAGSIINIRVKLYTNETLVHDQTHSITNLLERDIDFEITLNQRQPRQNIQFHVNQSELRLIKSTLGYNMMLYSGGHWLPNI